MGREATDLLSASDNFLINLCILLVNDLDGINERGKELPRYKRTQIRRHTNNLLGRQNAEMYRENRSPNKYNHSLKGASLPILEEYPV